MCTGSHAGMSTLSTNSMPKQNRNRTQPPRKECKKHSHPPRRQPIERKAWCERGDSNPHPLRDQILSLARLPIPPLSRNHRPFSYRITDLSPVVQQRRRFFYPRRNSSERCDARLAPNLWRYQEHRRHAWLGEDPHRWGLPWDRGTGAMLRPIPAATMRGFPCYFCAFRICSMVPAKIIS
jgi:hypothetical protein